MEKDLAFIVSLIRKQVAYTNLLLLKHLLNTNATTWILSKAEKNVLREQIGQEDIFTYVNSYYTHIMTEKQQEPCRYCGGNCPNDYDHACDGYLGDIDNLYNLYNDD